MFFRVLTGVCVVVAAAVGFGMPIPGLETQTGSQLNQWSGVSPYEVEPGQNRRINEAIGQFDEIQDSADEAAAADE